MVRNILITGGAGNIGGSLSRALVKDSSNMLVIVDNLTTGSMTKLPSKSYENWSFIKADVNNYNDISPIIINGNFDFIFHYAAVVGVQRTLNNPILVLNDILGVKNILDLSKNTGVKRIYFSSSSEVYGEPVETPQCEDTTPLNSRLPYAVVKNVAEAYCKSYYQEYSLNYTILRFFNTYGPLQSEDFVMTRFITQSLKNEDITIYGDGVQTRTFCYVDDNIDTIISSMNNNLWINDTANIGNDIEITILALAKMIIKHTNSNSKIVHLPALEEGDMTRRNPDVSKMKQVLVRDLTTLDDGISKTVSFIKKQLESNDS